MQFSELRIGMLVDFKLNRRDKTRAKDIDYDYYEKYRATVYGVYPYIATLVDKKGNKHTITKFQMITQEIDLKRVKEIDITTGMLQPSTKL